MARALEWAARPDAITSSRLPTTAYPRVLLEISDPPPLLYAHGRLELLRTPGARQWSAAATRPRKARAMPRQFAKALSEAGLTIVSGLALGIDAAAHRGGLAGRGFHRSRCSAPASTWSIPRATRNLRAEIAEQGCAVSEFPLGTPAIAHNFPRRNRLISGLARGCLVVEAALAIGLADHRASRPPIRGATCSRFRARSIRRFPRAATR